MKETYPGAATACWFLTLEPIGDSPFKCFNQQGPPHYVPCARFLSHRLLAPDDKRPAAGRGAVRRDQVLSHVEREEETDEIKIIDEAPGKSLAFSLQIKR
jgi:hypothetical protein